MACHAMPFFQGAGVALGIKTGEALTVQAAREKCPHVSFNFWFGGHTRFKSTKMPFTRISLIRAQPYLQRGALSSFVPIRA